MRLIGVVKLKPSKNVSIFSPAPKSAAKNMVIKSLFSMRSLLIKRPKIQNKSKAPITRSTINPFGFI